MARTATVTLEQVTKAAEALSAEGKTPGVRNIRDLLGSGSNQTIMQLLVKWQAQQPAVALPEAVPTSAGFLDAVTAELTRVQTVTAAVHAKALQEALAARDASDQEALRQFDEVQRLESLLNEKYKEVAQAEGQLKELTKRLAELKDSEAARVQAEQRAAVAEAKLEIQEPRAALVDSLQARISELTDQLHKAEQKTAPEAGKQPSKS